MYECVVSMKTKDQKSKLATLCKAVSLVLCFTTASSPTMAQDIDAGAKAFSKCKACHKLAADKNGVGPTLHQIMGRVAGSIVGYAYSDAMAASGVMWTPDTISEFLTKPKTYIKGTKMAFSGLKKPADIENLLAYLNEASK